ncbi:unnamed protein product [Rotaria sordida]|uniref:Uncharacterized protein n=1 Tax=Rotaria sordida TaxID=392033 RepID=A0A814H8J5_9BILA|nr:unnamed protein product [Rotaria sordida]CAF1183358.1 unnamed protein product [Rotaria sordida]CAF1188600.1 unnamed protein product [Rotaria sordida]CAF1223600.1 unnamed protein product [Rotaria sordida]
MEIGILACYALIATTSGSTAAITNSLVGPVTAAGIWVSIVIDIANWFLFKLVKQINSSQMWLINLICQCIALVFTIILIGITGNYVNTHQFASTLYCNSYGSGNKVFKNACSKYQLHQAQLAFAILIFFTQLFFIGLYVYLNIIVRPFPVAPAPIVYDNNQKNQAVHAPPPYEAQPYTGAAYPHMAAVQHGDSHAFNAPTGGS